MDTTSVVNLLKADLGEFSPSEERLDFLQQKIQAAVTFLNREGIILQDTVEDMELVEMYAAFLVRKRATAEAMPKYLRWAINNRLLSQKAKGT